MRTLSSHPQPGGVALLGLPFDSNSSFLLGAALAPGRIRESLLCGSSNLCSELGLDLAARSDWQDLGDLTDFGAIEARILELLKQDVRVLSLGGDHSVTYPILRAYKQIYPVLNILHLDAHPDLYHDYEGNPHSHASPFARIMEANLVKRLVQVGIRTINPHQRHQIERFGVEVIEMKDWNSSRLPRFDGPVYLSLDLDVLDPAFAPGVSHHEPGGFTSREIISLIQNLEGPLVGADIVELNPTRDPLGITAMLAAKLCKEISARLLH
jgi:agmatinase